MVSFGPVMLRLVLLYDQTERRARWRDVDGLWLPGLVLTHLAVYMEYAHGCYPGRETRPGCDQDRRCTGPLAPAKNVSDLVYHTRRRRLPQGGRSDFFVRAT